MSKSHVIEGGSRVLMTTTTDNPQATPLVTTQRRLTALAYQQLR